MYNISLKNIDNTFDYEELIKAGANFASSPKRINIHALDPAIVASSVALAEKSKLIDIISILDKTKYGKDGMGGIITNGTMYDYFIDKYGQEGAFNPQNVVLFGYSFTFTQTEMLKKNLATLKDSKKNLNINIDIRY